MRYYESTALIDARPEAVWAVLTEWAGARVEGQIAPQERIRVVSEVNPGRAFPRSTVRERSEGPRRARVISSLPS
jgi:hypothetical protein